MKIQYDPDLIKKLKNIDVRIRRSFEKRLTIFLENPYDPQLNNHVLREPYEGLRSIDITVDYRAIYEEIQEGELDEPLAYFTSFGTHSQLYKAQ